MSFSLNGTHIPRCQHIKTNGTQCGSPALRNKRFCYFHNRWRATRLDLNRAGALRVTTAVELPVLEDADSIQVALMQIMRLILCRQLDHKTGYLLLYGLQTASSNLGRIDFEHRRKTNVVIDPRRVRENGVGQEAWSPEDFAGEDSAEQEEQEGVGRAPSPATPSPSTRPGNQTTEATDIHELESALAGAKQGNWRDLKTVFELAGIFPAQDKTHDEP